MLPSCRASRTRPDEITAPASSVTGRDGDDAVATRFAERCQQIGVAGALAAKAEALADDHAFDAQLFDEDAFDEFYRRQRWQGHG